MYTLGSGDDSPEWNIEGVKLVKPDVTPLLDRISVGFAMLILLQCIRVYVVLSEKDYTWKIK